jgi:hypothetical protein
MIRMEQKVHFGVLHIIGTQRTILFMIISKMNMLVSLLLYILALIYLDRDIL